MSAELLYCCTYTVMYGIVRRVLTVLYSAELQLVYKSLQNYMHISCFVIISSIHAAGQLRKAVCVLGMACKSSPGTKMELL